MKVYFVTVGLQEELEVIKRVRPPRLLCSYWYFKNKPLAKLCEAIGYRPEILLDSGAYSAYTKGKNVNLLDYMAYIDANREYIESYITLDVIGNEGLTFSIYKLMVSSGLAPLPVIHYGGPPERADVYERLFCETQIALGGTVPVRDKRKVARWCNAMKEVNPRMRFHLLGSSSPTLLQDGALESCDASTWYLAAVKGRPKDIPGRTREAKMARAEVNMRRIMEEFDEIPVPFTDRGDERPDG